MMAALRDRIVRFVSYELPEDEREILRAQQRDVLLLNARLDEIERRRRIKHDQEDKDA